MSQNDPLLGSDWLANEELINDNNSGSTRLVPNGVNSYNNSNAKNNQLLANNTKTSLNSFSGNNNNNNINNSMFDYKQNPLMSGNVLANNNRKLATVMSDDSSTDDIVIPMQTRKSRQRYVRKRRSRSNDSSLSMKSASVLSCCPSLCLKILLTISIISTIALTIVFISKLYDRIDSLQTAINDLSLTGNNVPQEMHSIHTHLKELDSNSSSLRLELSRALDILTNLSTEVNAMKQQMSKISDSVEAAPAIKQIPKELQDLQKLVAEMGSRLGTNENELKSLKDGQSSQRTQTDSLVYEISVIHSNISDLFNVVEHSNRTDVVLSANSLNYSVLNGYNTSISLLNEKVDHLITVYASLRNWQTSADSRLNATMTLAHHIHDKLHHKTEEEKTATTVATTTTASTATSSDRSSNRNIINNSNDTNDSSTDSNTNDNNTPVF